MFECRKLIEVVALGLLLRLLFHMTIKLCSLLPRVSTNVDACLSSYSLTKQNSLNAIPVFRHNTQNVFSEWFTTIKKH